MENKFANQTEALSADKDSSLLHKLVHDAVPLNATGKTIVEESIKSAPLFIAGSRGLVLTLATHALAEIKANSSDSERITEGLAGAGKGFIIRKGFDAFGRLSPVLELLPTKYELALRGAGLGIVSRLTETTGTLDTWRDKQGNLDIGKGASLIGATVFSPVSLGCDVVSFGLSKGMHVGLNAATKGLVDRNAMLSMSVMGTAFGMNGSAIGEYTRQLSNNEKLDWQKIGNSTFIGAASGGLSSLPGGYQMHLKAASILRSMDYTSATEQILTQASPEKQTRQEITFSLRPAGVFANQADAKEASALEFRRPQHVAKLDELNPRISSKGPIQHELPVWKPNNPSSGEAPGPASGCVTFEHPVFKQYALQGHKTLLWVPVSYSQQLYSVREGIITERNLRKDGNRQGLDALKNTVIDRQTNNPLFKAEDYRNCRRRVLLEEVLLQLDQLPNSNLIKKLLLLPDRDPYDYLDKRGGRTTADAHCPTGTLRFYAANWNRAFHRTMRHEWGHLLAHEYPNWYKAFTNAAELENALDKKTPNPKPYGRTSISENWAVLGEELLFPKASAFIEWLNKAPKRSSAYCMALAESLVDNPAEVSIHREQLENRVNFVKQELIPRVKKQLLEELKHSWFDSDAAHRIELLNRLTGEVELDSLKTAINRCSTPVAVDKLLELAMKQLNHQPKEKIDFLISLGGNEAVNFARSQAISKLPTSQFDSYLFPRLQELESTLGNEHPKYKQLLDNFDFVIWSKVVELNYMPPLDMAIYWLQRAQPNTCTEFAYDRIIGKIEEAAKHHYKTGDLEQARKLYEFLVPLQEKLGASRWEMCELLTPLSEINFKLGNHEHLQSNLESLAKLGLGRREINKARGDLVDIFLKESRFEEAKKLIQQQLKDETRYTSPGVEVGKLKFKMAAIQQAQGQIADALATYQEALPLLKRDYIENIAEIQDTKRAIRDLRATLNQVSISANQSAND